MDFSNEWTDWHLTPKGWIKGDYKTDFKTVNDTEIPENRVLTRRYIETISSVTSPLRIYRKNVWATKDVHLIKSLIRKYEFPNSLSVAVKNNVVSHHK